MKKSFPQAKRRIRRRSEEILVDKPDAELEREMTRIDKRRKAHIEAL